MGMSTKNKILETLEEYPAGLSISDLSRKSGLHRNTVSQRANDLLEEGKVKYKNIGKGKVFYLPHNDYMHESIKNHGMVFAGIRTSKNKDSEKVTQEIAETVIRMMKLHSVNELPDFGVVFSTSRFSTDELIKEIHHVFGKRAEFNVCELEKIQDKIPR